MALLAIAAAKVKEWAQARVARERTDTFADGTTRASRFIFTENALYANRDGIWQTMQVSWAQRRAELAAFSHRMRAQQWLLAIQEHRPW